MAARDNKERKTRVAELLREEGCAAPLLHEQPVPRAGQPNVVCVLPGDNEDTVLVGAHFDRAGAGEGVVDNWSGAVLVPSLLHAIRNVPRSHTFVFVAFAGEEKGLLGSREYVEKLSKKQRARIRAMVNLDTLGLGPTKIWVNGSDPNLTGLLVALAHSMKLPIGGVNVEKVGTTDSAPFAANAIPAITVHSVTQETMPVLHSEKDTMHAVDFAAYYDSYRLLAAYLAYLDVNLGIPGAAPATQKK